MSVDILTGRSGHRESFAQLGQVGIIVNGHDANKIVNLETGVASDLGVPAPTLAPLYAGESSPGLVTGTVLYRFRWVDSSTQSYSLPSPTLSWTGTDKKVILNKTGTPPARATHWILERTLDGGKLFYPVNTDPDLSGATIWGTPIGTTAFTDNFADNNLDDLNAEALISDQFMPPPLALAWVNGQFLFLAGSRIHEVECVLTNGNAAVSSADGGFTAAMASESETLVAVSDVDGKSYRILSVADADNLTLAENYAGSSGTKACKITGQGNWLYWSEPGKPEYFGEQTLTNKCRNRVAIGAGGDRILGGIGLGECGCLIAKESRLYLLSYRLDPASSYGGGDGQLIELRERRGCLNQACLLAVGDLVFGADVHGVWVMQGTTPVEIAAPLRSAWQGLNFAQRQWFHLRHDAYQGLLMVFVVPQGETYPTRAYVFDLETKEWVGTREYPFGMTAGAELPDANGAWRTLAWNEPDGSASAFPWFLNIGDSLGAPPAAKLVGTVTGGSSTTLEDSTASWPTAGVGLDGVPVTLVRAADGSEETQLIVSNTDSELTTNTWQGTAPTAGDTYIVGALDASWKTGKIRADRTRKAEWQKLLLYMTEDSEAVDLLVRFTIDGTSFSQRITRSEDGVSTTDGVAQATVSPDDSQHVYQVDIGEWGHCIEVECYSLKSGQAWQIQDAELVFELEEGEEQTGV